jgi:hypothetical protein
MFAESSGSGVDSIQTAVALANTSSSTALSVTLELRADKSDVNLTTSLIIPPSGHVAKFLNGFFTKIPQTFLGTLKITAHSSDLAVAGLRTRYNERGDFLFSANPPITEMTPTGTPLVFPHLLNGGGFNTRLVFLNAFGLQASSTGSISVAADSPSPWTPLRPYLLPTQ